MAKKEQTDLTILARIKKDKHLIIRNAVTLVTVILDYLLIYLVIFVRVNNKLTERRKASNCY